MAVARVAWTRAHLEDVLTAVEEVVDRSRADGARLGSGEPYLPGAVAMKRRTIGQDATAANALPSTVPPLARYVEGPT